MIITNQSKVQFSFTLPDESTETKTQESNLVTTEVLSDVFTKVKSSNKTFLLEGETAEQTVVFTNGSTKTLTDLFFKDVMTAGATYVAGSVTINGTSYPAYDAAAGFALPDMAPNDVITVKYTIISNDPLTENTVTNYANIAYTVDETNFNENSNQVTIALLSSRMEIVKAVNKSVAVSGDILHYTSTITNTGTIEKTNLTFTDPIPAGSTFVNHSVKINSVSYATYDPATGFALPDLAVGESVVVEFDVEVN